MYINGILIGETPSIPFNGIPPVQYRVELYNAYRTCAGFGLVTCSSGGALIWDGDMIVYHPAMHDPLDFHDVEAIYNKNLLCYKGPTGELHVSSPTSFRFVDLYGNKGGGTGEGGIDGEVCN